jgi:hypothetical protein
MVPFPEGEGSLSLRMLPQVRSAGSGELSGAQRLTVGVDNPCQPYRNPDHRLTFAT